MTSTLYDIVVEGHLDRVHWSLWFGGMRSTLGEDGTTKFSGPVPDQAALHGLLNRVRDLGLVLVAVHRKEPGIEESSESGGSTDDRC